MAAAAAHMASSPEWRGISTALKGMVYDTWWLNLTDDEIYDKATHSVGSQLWRTDSWQPTALVPLPLGLRKAAAAVMSTLRV